MAAILKWLPQPPAVTSGWGPVLKSTVIGYSNCVPSLLLVSQSARNGSKWALSDRTTRHLKLYDVICLIESLFIRHKICKCYIK